MYSLLFNMILIITGNVILKFEKIWEVNDLIEIFFFSTSLLPLLRLPKEGKNNGNQNFILVAA